MENMGAKNNMQKINPNKGEYFGVFAIANTVLTSPMENLRCVLSI